MLEECTLEEERVLVRFFFFFFCGQEGFLQTIFTRKCFSVYGEKCLSREAVHNRVGEFSLRRSNIDEKRTGRPVEIATEVAVRRVEESIPFNRRVTTDSVAIEIGCSRGLSSTFEKCVHGGCPDSRPRNTKIIE